MSSLVMLTGKLAKDTFKYSHIQKIILFKHFFPGMQLPHQLDYCICVVLSLLHYSSFTSCVILLQARELQ